MNVISDSHPKVPGHLSQRAGRFAVGAFAGLCAAFVPRLAFIVGPGASTTALTMDAFDERYIAAALGFSVLIGGVALILEWESERSPRDTFMAALGIPAILTGMFNTASASRDAVMLGERLKIANDSRAEREDIPVEDRAPQSTIAPSSGSLLEWRLLPIAFAAEQAPAQIQYKGDVAKVGVVYREPRYWVVLDTKSTQADADRRAAELRKLYGPMRVQRVDRQYFVCPAEGTFAYSAAVAKAIELKRRSQGALTPRLVRSS
jgi:hypothetical protein